MGEVLKPVLRTFIENFIKKYPEEKNNKLQGNQFAEYIQTNVPQMIYKEKIVDETIYSVKGRVGSRGEWSDVPWVGIFHREVAKKDIFEGVYITYLLSQEEKKIYLTFSFSYLEEYYKHKNNAIEKAILEEKVENVRKVIPVRDASTSLGNLKEIYKWGCVYSKEYHINSLPEENVLRDDLHEFIEIYEEYVEKYCKPKDDENMIPCMTDKVENAYHAPNCDKNMILYGPPGTGKTYHTAIYAVAVCTGRTVEEVIEEITGPDKGESYAQIMEEFHELEKENRIAFTTFHQSYGYEEFIEGIKPEVGGQNESIGYTIADGVFKEFCKRALEDRLPYVFIIDEINRGNISKIFGELITLLEDTKRAGMPEAASAILPYSGENFSVPQNVYIIGTMNTADRSIALMDTALRRRFQFIEMMPDSSVLKGLLDNTDVSELEGLDVVRMLDKINERIAFLYDREHTIGHAFFTKLAKEPTLKCLKSIFKKSVIPLLQEYFFEDYHKIQLVLGDNGKTNDKYKFILEENVDRKKMFKGNEDLTDVVDFDEKKYRINEEAFDLLESYKEII